MNKEDILKLIRSLSNSQGFYSKLYNFLSEDSEESRSFLTELENQNFKDCVDLILYLES